MVARKAILANVLWLVTAVALAALNAFVGVKTGYSLMGFYLWFVIPVGAVVTGALNGLSYSLIARSIHHRPSLKSPMPLIVALVFISLSYAFGFKFVLIERDSFVPFTLGRAWEFAQASVTNTSLSFGSESSASVGSIGYALLAIEIVGFVAGGWLILRELLTRPWSESSSQYLKRTRREVKKLNALEANGETLKNLIAAVNDGDVEQAFAHVDVLGAAGEKTHRVELAHFEAPGTGEFLLLATLHSPGNNRPIATRIAEYRHEATSTIGSDKVFVG